MFYKTMYPYTDQIMKVYQTGHSVSDLVQRIGMTPPPTTTDLKQYFLDNVREYELVLSRKEVKVLSKNEISSLAMEDSLQLQAILSRFTDMELFGIFGFYVVYNSRKDLINNLLSGMYGMTFFVRFDETTPSPQIRYGSQIGSSDVLTPDNLDTKLNHINQMRQLKEMLRIYSVPSLATKLDGLMQAKIDWQTNLWPASKEWLVR